jgi:hypothetical protein
MHSFMPPHFMNSFVSAVTPVDVTHEWTRTGTIGYYFFTFSELGVQNQVTYGGMVEVVVMLLFGLLSSEVLHR